MVMAEQQHEPQEQRLPSPREEDDGAVTHEPSDAVREQLATLNATRVMERAGGKSAAEAAKEVNAALKRLEPLQQEYVDKQTQQNLLDKLMHVESLEELRRAATAAPQTRKAHIQAHLELQSAVKERVSALRQLERLAQQVEQQKQRLIENDGERPAHERKLERLRDEWKQLQKRNAQRKASLRMSTGIMINDEEDCSRVLEQQTQSIQELHQKQEVLEEKRIDISTRVKQTKEKIGTLTKQNDARSKDVEVKKREQEFLTLQNMNDWYDQMREVQASLTGIKIVRVGDGVLEVLVLQRHSLRLHFEPESMTLERVEFDDAIVPTDDLVETAVRDNNVQLLLRGYQQRLLSLRTP